MANTQATLSKTVSKQLWKVFVRDYHLRGKCCLSAATIAPLCGGTYVAEKVPMQVAG